MVLGIGSFDLGFGLGFVLGAALVIFFGVLIDIAKKQEKRSRRKWEQFFTEQIRKK